MPQLLQKNRRFFWSHKAQLFKLPWTLLYRLSDWIDLEEMPGLWLKNLTFQPSVDHHFGGNRILKANFKQRNSMNQSDQNLVNSRICEALEKLTDIQLYHNTGRMTQPEQFKLHNDTCEATDIVYDTLGKIRYQIVADMIQQQFAQKMSERLPRRMGSWRPSRQLQIQKSLFAQA